MIRLGILDFDTSHVVEFTKRINHKGIDKDQWVDGAEVTLGCPGESQLAPERIPGFKKEMENLGVPLVDKPADLIGKVDGVLVESLEGGVHLERAKPFLEAGLPCYVDKPFACSGGRRPQNGRAGRQAQGPDLQRRRRCATPRSWRPSSPTTATARSSAPSPTGHRRCRRRRG